MYSLQICTIAILLVSVYAYVPYGTWNNNREQSCTNCVCGAPVRNRRVINGKPANRIDYPWVVILRKNGYYKCTGSLLTPRHVITAAHCLVDSYAQQFQVAAGRYNVPGYDASEKQYRVRALHVHEYYNSKNFDNDIGIMELESPVQLNDDMQLICLPGESHVDYSGLVGTVVGWGRTDKNSGNVFNTLHTGDVPILSTAQCSRSLYYQGQVTQNMMCAGYLQGGRDACIGDSGAPLQVKREHGSYELAGVVSWGIGCADPGYPGVYTRVTNYLDWIRARTGNECPCRPHSDTSSLLNL
ncbi:trypsin-3 [Orussus abietinus]|uniref:trypsin-3 n=1 Tax=Orussus abietinus TaxID=222816 RepID=UPI000625CE54|nr:trypsin-3 [Orussus abietinus]